MECSICLSPDCTGLIKINCGHSFHADCLKEWIRHQHPQASYLRKVSGTCPLCRQRTHELELESVAKRTRHQCLRHGHEGNVVLALLALRQHVECSEDESLYHENQSNYFRLMYRHRYLLRYPIIRQRTYHYLIMARQGDWIPANEWLFKLFGSTCLDQPT